MKKLVEIKTIQEVLYMYDSEEEYITEYNKMLENGWECGGKSYVVDNAYYQKYSREMNY